MTLAKSAKQSWCLSGTPIFNGLQDLYPAFNIIRMPELSNSIRFEKILENSSNPTKTIQISLRAAMIRRTKEDVFLGKPLMKLPPKEIREVSVKFDPDARVLYDALEDRARDEINSLSKVKIAPHAPQPDAKDNTILTHPVARKAQTKLQPHCSSSSTTTPTL